MKPLDQREELQAYYQDERVVAEYLRRRTAQPLNGLLHRSQVAFLNRAIRERRPKRILEIAPGPARLTAELEYRGQGFAIDASPAMLATARSRLRERGMDWLISRGDAFCLPFRDDTFDFVYTLKFVRHFQLEDRRRLYAEIQRVMTPHGVFVLDAQNRAISLPHRQRKGLDSYRIYDVLYDRRELVAELESVGFRVARITGMINHFRVQQSLNRLRRLGLANVARSLIGAVEHLPTKNPSTWMLLNEVA
jgi:ubiquinone/menaquinone biosynthesis C-methylase UbiE